MRGKPTSSFFPLNPSFCLCGTLHGFTAMCNALSLISLPHHLIFSHLHPFPPCLCPNEALAQPQWDGSAACHGSPQPHSECAHQGGIGTPKSTRNGCHCSVARCFVPPAHLKKLAGREVAVVVTAVWKCISALHNCIFFPGFWFLPLLPTLVAKVQLNAAWKIPGVDELGGCSGRYQSLMLC